MFTWGGCDDGNLNRFKTVEECEAKCFPGNSNGLGATGVLGKGSVNAVTPNEIRNVEAALIGQVSNVGPRSGAKNIPQISIR